MPAPLNLPAPPLAWIRRLAGNSWTWGEWGRVLQVSLKLMGSEHHGGQACPTYSSCLLTGSLSAEHPLARAGRRRVATACPWAAGERYPWHPPTVPFPSWIPTPCWMLSPQGVCRRLWEDRELPIPALFLVHRQRQGLCFLGEHHLPNLFPQTRGLQPQEVSFPGKPRSLFSLFLLPSSHPSLFPFSLLRQSYSVAQASLELYILLP